MSVCVCTIIYIFLFGSLQPSGSFFLVLYCNGITALVLTMLCVCVCSCLEYLLDNGADPSLRDKQGYSAVHYAAAHGNKQNLELVRAGKLKRLPGECAALQCKNKPTLHFVEPQCKINK